MEVSWDAGSIPAASIESQSDTSPNTLPESGQILPQSDRVFGFVETAHGPSGKDASLTLPTDGHLQSTNIAEESHRIRTSSTSENRDFLQKLPEDLAELVQKWPALPDHIKAAILAIIQTVKP